MNKEFIGLLDEEQAKCLTLYELGLDFGNDVPITLNFVFELKISEYKLGQLVEKLSQDLQSKIFDGGPKPELLFYKGYIQFKNISSLGLRQLRCKYAQESVRFAIFDYLLVGKEHESKRHFIERVHISRSYFYRMSSEINRILHNMFHLDKNSSELEVRETIFDVYYYFFNGIIFPFSEYLVNVKDLLSQLRLIFLKPLLPTQIEQLRYILAIQNIRIDSGKQFTIGIINDRNYYISETKKILEEVYQINDSKLNEETEFLVGSMMINEIIRVNTQDFTSDFRKDVVRMTELEIQIVDDEVDSSFNRAKLEKSFNMINFRALFPFFNGSTFFDHKRTSFFRDVYPNIDAIATKEIKVVLSKLDRELLFENVNQIYYYFLFSLIGTIPTNAFRDTVFITVDFSQGTLYTEYVKSRLMDLVSLNIVIDSTVFSRTDLYISDSYMANVYLPQVILQDPIHDADWKQLANQIMKIKKEKYRDSGT